MTNKQDDKYQGWYYENHDNKLDDLPDYFNRTPESEIKYKLLWFGILFLMAIGAIIGLIIFIFNQIYG